MEGANTVAMGEAGSKKRKHDGESSGKPKKKVVLDAPSAMAAVSSVVRPKYCPPVIGMIVLVDGEALTADPSKRVLQELSFPKTCRFTLTFPGRNRDQPKSPTNNRATRSYYYMPQRIAAWTTRRGRRSRGAPNL